MQELVGRLTALDPEASETLKVVAYFDVLVAGGVGLQALLRGAAVLSGAVAGASDSRRTYRIGPDGDRLPDGAAPDTAVRDVAAPEPSEAQRHRPTCTISNGRVWLERDGTPHANDEMVIERLALAVDLVAARGTGRAGSALEIAIDAARDVEERRVALSRLRLDPARETRVAVLPLSHDAPASTVVATVVATPYGLVRAVVLGQDATVSGPAGVGIARRGDELPESFRTALLALRLLPERDAVAAALGMHHSTLQARHETLTSELGYDPRSLDGRSRFRLARLLLRLVEDR